MRIIIIILILISFSAQAGQHRSYKAKADFKRMQHCPSTGSPKGPCPGWIIDHITALKRGGADAASNMQWQTVLDAKAKDRWE